MSQTRDTISKIFFLAQLSREIDPHASNVMRRIRTECSPGVAGAELWLQRSRSYGCALDVKIDRSDLPKGQRSGDPSAVASSR